MIIGIDIDDTLTYLKDVRIKTAEKYIKKNHLNFRLVRTDTYLFSEMFDWSAEECDKFWFAEGDKMLASVPARKNASKVITKLKSEGNKIIIITARTKEVHADPYKLSYDWLVKNRIPFDELLIGHLDKTQVCAEKHIDWFIDDKPSTLEKLNGVGIKTILMKNPHNENIDNLKNYTVVENWNEIYDIIEK